jgi:hypothetical protein
MHDHRPKEEPHVIDIITSHDVQQLAETTADHCVSVFLPTHRTGPDQAQDPIRLKNLLARAAAELGTLGLRGPDAERLLAPVAALREDAAFWAHQDNGLAIYLSGDSMTTYRLPEPLEELVVVSDRFHVKPVIASLATGKAFHVLALSQHEIRLLRGSTVHLTEIEVSDIPNSLAEALWWDDRERQLHSHGADRVGKGRVVATFHGHGGAKDTTKVDLARFFRAVDNGITHVIAGQATPLVLAGVDFLLAIYRSCSRYPRIVGEAIEGNPEQLSADELHAHAWPLVQPILDQDRTTATEQFLAGAALTSSSLPDTLVAAASGRVDTLFVPTDVQLWGTSDSGSQLVDQHESRQPGDRDLLDTAALDTLTHSGTVFAVPAQDIPGAGPLAVTLRY